MALVAELSVVCPWVCFGKSSQILRHLFAVACISGDCEHWRLALGDLAVAIGAILASRQAFGPNI